MAANHDDLPPGTLELLAPGQFRHAEGAES